MCVLDEGDVDCVDVKHGSPLTAAVQRGDGMATVVDGMVDGATGMIDGMPTAVDGIVDGATGMIDGIHEDANLSVNLSGVRDDDSAFVSLCVYMCVYICVCVYIYIHIYIYIYACMFVCMCVYICVCGHVNLSGVRDDDSAFVCVCMCVCIPVYVCVCVCVYTCCEFEWSEGR
jgi:hypothetical protein